MLRIYTKQLDTYQEKLDERLSKKLLNHIKEEHHNALDGFTDEIILRIIHIGMRRARSYQLESEYAIAVFIDLMIEISFSFDQHPVIQESLRRIDLEDKQRVNLLVKITTEQDWRETSQFIEAIH